MDKIYDSKLVEEKIYNMWEIGGYFQPEINKSAFRSTKKEDKFSIILPPPNANGDLHFGHAMFVIEDILIRYKRMQGNAVLWLPGTDHAGTETQFVFEKKLQLEGKSRFDYNRQELFDMIWKYVTDNRGGIEKQLRRLGFSLDWSRQKFTLDADIVAIVKKTFRSMYEDKLVYREYRLVNYCTKDGTSFSDLEVVNEEREGILYYIQFPLKEAGHITIATTRPETLVGDVAVMVNPRDDRYKKYIGKTVVLPFVNREIPVIADEYVKMDFGTGAVKVTPAHDFNDFAIAKKHNLTYPPIIGFDGKMQHTKGILDGLYVKQARVEIVKKLQEAGLLEKEEAHKIILPLCYKCKTVLEPLPLEQWYVKVKPLIDNAIAAVDKEFVRIYPQSFVHALKLWYEGLRDWNISRQNVWGIQIPVWYEIEKEKEFSVSFIGKDKRKYQGQLDQLLFQEISLDEIVQGIQKVIAPITARVVFEDQKEKGKRYLPETDTFDTWFSSGQWPYVTLKTAKPGDFEKFYPTSVMETGYDILRAWVSRMLLLGLYIANGKHVTEIEKLKETVPFRDVVLHGLVNDPLGKKMSKSKGNVVNPLELVDQYGADAVRFALVYGTGLGNDQAMSYTKLDSARKFTNKLWNMARFIEMKRVSPRHPEASAEGSSWGEKILRFAQNDSDKDWIKKIKELSEETTKYIDAYQFNLAAERLYEFIWHEFADIYIEDVKNRMDENSSLVLTSLFLVQLKLLHPFMPFVTEEIYQRLYPQEAKNTPLIIASWPR